MQILRDWTDRISGWANHFVALLLLSMFVTFLLQIIFRYLVSEFLGTGIKIDWTVEWVTISWLWGILFSFTFVLRTQDMIRLDIIYDAVPDGWRRGFDIFTGLTVAGIFGYTLPHAWDYVTFMGIERTAAFRWPFDLVFGIYIPFHISVIVRMLLVAWGGFVGTKSQMDASQTEEEASDA